MAGDRSVARIEANTNSRIVPRAEVGGDTMWGHTVVEAWCAAMSVYSRNKPTN